jgi:hypothetical protein
MQSRRAEIANARSVHVRIVSGFDASAEGKQGQNALELASLVKLGHAYRGDSPCYRHGSGSYGVAGFRRLRKSAHLIAIEGDPLADISCSMSSW